jgi:LemA protein
MVILVAVSGAAIVLIVAFLWAFNRLVRQRNLVADAWSGIDVALTRRADLVPNLVEVVAAYAAHERQTLDQVVSAREQVNAAAGPLACGQADDILEGKLRRLFAVSEAYPDLKANTNFLELQAELSRLEEDISFARRYYNAHARKYNDMQQTFPVVLVARILGHHPAEFFKADALARGGVGADLAGGG